MKTCLIVDDSGVIRKASRRMLEELEFTCSEAENGQIAVDACAASMPDVLVITGPCGVGKSSVAFECMEILERAGVPAAMVDAELAYFHPKPPRETPDAPPPELPSSLLDKCGSLGNRLEHRLQVRRRVRAAQQHLVLCLRQVRQL